MIILTDSAYIAYLASQMSPPQLTTAEAVFCVSIGLIVCLKVIEVTLTILERQGGKK